MRIGFFITARLKSTRLRKKILLDLEGQTVLGHVIQRAQTVPGIDDVVVCTSTVAEDRPILKVCDEHLCRHFTGSPDDVLNRLLMAARYFDCDYLLLMTADNPLFSFEYAQRLVDEIQRGPDVDFLGVEGLPLGMDPYIVRRKAFEVIDVIKDDGDTEFWPEYMRDPSVFERRSIPADPEHKRPYRVTLDYPQDLALFESIYRDLYAGKPIPTSSVIQYLDSNPSVRELNAAIVRSWLSEGRVNEIHAHLLRHREQLLALKSDIYGIS